MPHYQVCIYCRQQFKSFHSLKKHKLSCDVLLSMMSDEINEVKSNKSFKQADRPCEFCSKLCKNVQSLRSHERLCSLNPNKLISPRIVSNDDQQPKFNRSEYIKSKKTCELCGIEINTSWMKNHIKNCKMNIDVTKQCKFCNQSFNNVDYKPHVSSCTEKHKAMWTEENRKHHSSIMTDVVISNPNSYTKSNRGRVKHINYDGIDFHGNWELDFYKWCKNNLINVVRNEQSFPYTYDKERMYFPDFFLPEHDIYIEIKGYQTDRDVAKWKHFPHKLLIIKNSDMKKSEITHLFLDV